MPVKGHRSAVRTFAALPLMNATVPYQHLWSSERLTSSDLQVLLHTAAMVKNAKKADPGWSPLRGRYLALLCRPGNEAALGFQRAVTELGAAASLLNAEEWRQRAGERVPDAARLLGRLYDAIDCCDLPPEIVEQIELHSGVPVFNGLATADHPLTMLGELMTMQETGAKPLDQSRLGLTHHDAGDGQLAGLTLARLAGMHILPSPAPAPPRTPAVGAAPASEPDFILDTGSAATDHRLSTPHASSEQQAELNGRLANNRRCTLQAALICGLQ
jgi:ornithine carbamoyltransferase